MSSFDLNDLITISTAIIAIIGLIMYFKDRKIIGAKFIIPEARLTSINRIDGHGGSLPDLEREEAIKFTGHFQLNFILMNIGDRMGFIRFIEAYVISSDITFELHNMPKTSVYETMAPPGEQLKKGLTFSIPKNIWFDTTGNLIIKGEFVDYKGSFEPLEYKIPITAANRFL